MDSTTLVTFLKGFTFRNELWEVIIPISMMGIDIISGIIYAWESGTFKSKKMRTGLSKKIGEIEIIIIGELFAYGLGIPPYIMSGISMYIIFMEGLSIAENFKKIGTPLPKFVYDALDTIDDAVNNDNAEAMKRIAELEKLVEQLQGEKESK